MGSIGDFRESGSVKDLLDDDDNNYYVEDYTEEEHEMDNYAEQHGTYIQSKTTFTEGGLTVRHTHYGNDDQVYEVYDGNVHIGTARNTSELMELVDDYKKGR